MIRRPPRSTLDRSSAASDVYKRQVMDVYTPTGDTETARPLIVYLHTGSFLPRYLNQLVTGSKSDSATVEMCKQFAKKGYVVAAIGYRTGWNPASPSEQTRKQTIIQAVYRSMQDTKTAVRYFRKSIAEDANPYGVNGDQIVIGGLSLIHISEPTRPY